MCVCGRCENIWGLDVCGADVKRRSERFVIGRYSAVHGQVNEGICGRDTNGIALQIGRGMGRMIKTTDFESRIFGRIEDNEIFSKGDTI